MENFSRRMNFGKKREGKVKQSINPLYGINPFLYHQKTRAFLLFLGGIEKYQWHKMG